MQSDILFTTHRSEVSSSFFSLCSNHLFIFLSVTKQRLMEKTEQQRPLSPSVRLRLRPSSSQVCARPFVVCVPCWREKSHRHVTSGFHGFRNFAHQFLSKFPAFVTCIILSDLPFPLLIQLKMGQLDQFGVSWRCFASHPRRFSGSG